MSNSNGMAGTALGAVALVAAGVCGIAAAMYAVVVAYISGSEAQAAIDGCAPADPASLARMSVEQLAGAVGASANSVPDIINIDDADVSVK